MSLRYSFRHLFYGGKIQKERLYKVLQDLDDANGGETLDIKDIKDAIGKASGEGAGGILKDVADIKTDIGVATSGSETGIHKDIVDVKGDITTLQTVIGDESSEGTILARIKALEEHNQ